MIQETFSTMQCKINLVTLRIFLSSSSPLIVCKHTGFTVVGFEQLFQLIKTKTDLDEGDRVKQSALFFLLEHAYFEADFKVRN